MKYFKAKNKKIFIKMINKKTIIKNLNFNNNNNNNNSKYNKIKEKISLKLDRFKVFI